MTTTTATSARAVSPAVPPPARSTVARDTWIVFTRAMRLSLRNPVWVFIMMMQPMLYLFLFSPLLKPIAGEIGASFGVDNEYQVFVPGLIVQLGIFGAMFVGFALIGEYRAGVIESMRVTPASRVALLAGRVLRDVIVLLIQALILLALSLAMGLRASFAGVVVAIAIVVLLGIAFASASYAVALVTKSEDALAPLLNGVALPVLLLSGILLPMQLGPGWLRRLSDFNPLKHVVDGVRAMFAGETTSSTALWGLFWAAVLALAGFIGGTLTFRKESS